MSHVVNSRPARVSINNLCYSTLIQGLVKLLKETSTTLTLKNTSICNNLGYFCFCS